MRDNYALHNFRVYYAKEGTISRTYLMTKRQALSLFEVHSDEAFLVTKEKGWWRRPLRFKSLSALLIQRP